MKTVTVQVNDAAEKVVVGVLTHLEHLSGNGQTRTIRIGGDEKVYDGSVCGAFRIEVDGQLQDGYTPIKPQRKSSSNSTGSVSTPPSVSAAAAVTQQATTQGANVNDELEEKVDVILSDLCNGEGLFTAFDITREIRSDGTRCRHKNVRQIVHDTYNNGEMADNYIRSLIFVDSSHQAFVYHPDDVDPNVYVGGNADADADDAGNTVSNAVSSDPLNDLD